MRQSRSATSRAHKVRLAPHRPLGGARHRVRHRLLRLHRHPRPPSTACSPTSPRASTSEVHGAERAAAAASRSADRQDQGACPACARCTRRSAPRSCCSAANGKAVKAAGRRPSRHRHTTRPTVGREPPPSSPAAAAAAGEIALNKGAVKTGAEPRRPHQGAASRAAGTVEVTVTGVYGTQDRHRRLRRRAVRPRKAVAAVHRRQHVAAVNIAGTPG